MVPLLHLSDQPKRFPSHRARTFSKCCKKMCASILEQEKRDERRAPTNPPHFSPAGNRSHTFPVPLPTSISSQACCGSRRLQRFSTHNRSLQRKGLPPPPHLVGEPPLQRGASVLFTDRPLTMFTIIDRAHDLGDQSRTRNRQQGQPHVLTKSTHTSTRASSWTTPIPVTSTALSATTAINIAASRPAPTMHTTHYSQHARACAQTRRPRTREAEPTDTFVTVV